jgi:hypothetical protein
VSVIEEERTMEASSTDKRIDELAGEVRRFEGKVERRFERFEDKVDARFDKVDARFDKVDARLASWAKIIGGGVATIVVTIVSAVVLKLFGV